MDSGKQKELWGPSREQQTNPLQVDLKRIDEAELTPVKSQPGRPGISVAAMKSVLHHLRRCQGNGRVCDWKQWKLGRVTGLKESQLRRTLRRLEQLGLVETTQRTRGRKRWNVYRVVMAPLAPQQPIDQNGSSATGHHDRSLLGSSFERIQDPPPPPLSNLVCNSARAALAEAEAEIFQGIRRADCVGPDQLLSAIERLGGSIEHKRAALRLGIATRRYAQSVAGTTDQVRDLAAFLAHRLRQPMGLWRAWTIPRDAEEADRRLQGDRPAPGAACAPRAEERAP